MEINKEMLLGLEPGDAVRYRSTTLTYLIVDSVDVQKGLVYGQMAGPIGVNAISIDDLLVKKELKIIKLDGTPADLNKKFAIEMDGFKLGDIIDSFGCEKGRPYMPGTGHIISIMPQNERPFVCEHNDKTYRYNAKEIEHSDIA